MSDGCRWWWIRSLILDIAWSNERRKNENEGVCVRMWETLTRREDVRWSGSGNNGHVWTNNCSLKNPDYTSEGGGGGVRVGSALLLELCFSSHHGCKNALNSKLNSKREREVLKMGGITWRLLAIGPLGLKKMVPVICIFKCCLSFEPSGIRKERKEVHSCVVSLLPTGSGNHRYFMGYLFFLLCMICWMMYGCISCELEPRPLSLPTHMQPRRISFLVPLPRPHFLFLFLFPQTGGSTAPPATPRTASGSTWPRSPPAPPGCSGCSSTASSTSCGWRCSSCVSCTRSDPPQLASTPSSRPFSLSALAYFPMSGFVFSHFPDRSSGHHHQWEDERSAIQAL